MGHLATIEAMAETDLPGALRALRALPPPATPPVLLLEAELLARSGQLEAAFAPLDTLQTLCDAAPDLAVEAEAAVLRASVVAALGRFDEAMPMLASVIGVLEGHPSLTWLRDEARAELRAYSNLVSPKSAATWSSLLT